MKLSDTPNVGDQQNGNHQKALRKTGIEALP